jgi:hypothetical protein
MLVLALLSARMKRAEAELKEVSGHFNGRDGMYLKVEGINGRLNTAEAEIGALKSVTLTREIFDRATREHTEKLKELKDQTKELDEKVEKIDRTLMAPPSRIPSFKG